MQNPDRRALLNRFADNIEKNMVQLATIESTDNGKPFGMACYDTMLAIEMMRYYAGWTEKC
jgi:aldehyde dehydrogenase (NAD+)